MKKTIIVIGLALLVAVCVFAQDNPSITIVNNTGNNVRTIYLRCSYKNQNGSTSNTEQKIEITPYLSPGNSTTTKLPVPLNTVNIYDIEMVFTDGKSQKANNVTVSANARISFGSSGSSGTSNSSGSSGGLPPGFTQNPDGTITMRSGGTETTYNPITGYGTVTSICPICSGTGRIQALNPMYGMGAADSIRYGYRNTTPMYTMQICYMCNGLGKTITNTYVDPNSLSSKGSSGGSSSSSSSGGSSGGGGGRSTTLSKHAFCNGTGQVFGGYSADYTGNSISTWCDICQANKYPHYHTKCTGCNGTGYN